MTRPTEIKPATVPLAQQAGEIPAEWLWVKPCAWTVRMLTALITGVKGQNQFFAEHGLLNLKVAHAQAVQSLTR